jgi:hypothetical protein
LILWWPDTGRSIVALRDRESEVDPATTAPAGSRLIASAKAGVVFTKADYTYDRNGNPTTVVTADETQTYTPTTNATS